MKRHLIRPALVGALIAAWPLSTVAVVSPAPTRVPSVSPLPSATPALNPGATPSPVDVRTLTATEQATRIATLKTKGDVEISRRLTALADAKGKIQNLTTLTQDDQNALNTEVTNDMTKLKSLRTTLDSETTLTGARTDVQSIISDYRVYVLVLPVARLVEAIDKLTDVENKLTTLQAKIQGGADKEQSGGKNVTAIQKSVSDMQSQINAAQNATTGLTAKLLALQPSDYNTNHAVLMQYRTNLGSAETALKTARDDANSAIVGLNTL